MSGKVLADELRRVARDGLGRYLDRRGQRTAARDVAEYERRLDLEVDALERLGGYEHLLHAGAVAREARRRGIVIAPGTWNIGSSLVCLGLGLTEIDPLEHGLVFWRFVHPGSGLWLRTLRLEVAQSRSEELAAWVCQAHGGRRLQPCESDEVDWPAQRPVEVVLGANDVAPPEHPTDATVRTRYWRAGYAVLELASRWSLDVLAACSNELDAPAAIDLDDAATYELLAAEGAVPNGYSVDAAEQVYRTRLLAPRNFEELIAAVSFAAPFHRTQRERYLEAKRGRLSDLPVHPVVEEVLAPTFGCLLYHEQALWIAHRVAGYPFDDAELFRREVLKQRVKQITAHRHRFIEGAGQRGTDAATAAAIFNLLLENDGPWLGRATGVSEAIIAYRLAYLRVHHADAFDSAVRLGAA